MMISEARGNCSPADTEQRGRGPDMFTLRQCCTSFLRPVSEKSRMETCTIIFCVILIKTLSASLNVSLSVNVIKELLYLYNE